jgi:hypothetical protein
VPEHRTPVEWLSSVSGAAVLNRLFIELSETRVTYDKVRDGVALTEWLLENHPEELVPLGQFLVGLLPDGERNEPRR